MDLKVYRLVGDQVAEIGALDGHSSVRRVKAGDPREVRIVITRNVDAPVAVDGGVCITERRRSVARGVVVRGVVIRGVDGET